MQNPFLSWTETRRESWLDFSVSVRGSRLSWDTLKAVIRVATRGQLGMGDRGWDRMATLTWGNIEQLLK